MLVHNNFKNIIKTIILSILLLLTLCLNKAYGQYAHPANAIKTTNSNVQQDIDSLYAKTNDLYTNISTLETYVKQKDTELYTNISTLEVKVNNNFNYLHNNISTLEAYVNYRDNVLFNNISTLENKVNNNFNYLHNNISTLEAYVNQNDIALYNNISTLENKVNNNFNYLYTNISTLENYVNQRDGMLYTNISTLEVYVKQVDNSLFTNISTLENKVNNNFSYLHNNISTLEAYVNQVDNSLHVNISTLEIKVNDNFSYLHTNISTLENKVNSNYASLFTNVSTLETYVNQQDMGLYTNISTLENKVNQQNSDLYTNISTLENYVNGRVIKVNNTTVDYPANFVNSPTALFEYSNGTIKVNVIGGTGNDINGIYKIYGDNDVLGTTQYEVTIRGVNGVTVNRINNATLEINIDNATKWNNYYTKTESDGRYSQVGHTHSASDINVSTTDFNNNLNSTHNTVQKALDAIDDINIVNGIQVNGDTARKGVINLVAGTGMEITSNGNNITFNVIGGGSSAGTFSEVLATQVSDTVWELDTIYNHNKIVVFRNGVFQRKGAKYTLSNTSTKTRITFSKTTYASDEIIALIIN